jgi:transposase
VARRSPEDPAPDPQQIIEDQAREIQRLRGDLRRSEAERQRLRRENEKLKDELEAARRAVYRQAAPFSRGDPKSQPRRPGRKPGAQYGVRAHRRVPPRVDEVYEAPLPESCAHCGGAVQPDSVASQYQEDIPIVPPLVREFRVHIGHCAQCHRRVQGRHALQTSDALGAAAVQLGPEAIALAAVLNKQLGLSYGKIARLFRQRFGLGITRGGLVHALRRVARRGMPTYQALCATVRGSPVVTVDETSWRVAALLEWLWVWTTPTTTVYAILPGRGLTQAASVIGLDYAGVLEHDGWHSYRYFVRALHQTCLAHLLRRCRVLMLDYPSHPFAPAVKTVLQAALTTRDRYLAAEMSAHGLAVARGRYLERLAALLERRPSRLLAIRRFAAHLRREFEAIFSFLFEPTVEATTWRAEQALRPAVVNRKMGGGGNRTARGAQTQQILMSILRTADQRGLDSTAVLVTLLRAARPHIPTPFEPPPAVH